uniref:Uncharacterized protein n=1 Tax=Ditylenchus dipsaci TaxID=166011 RepID=A0A915D242_9BILA
MSTGDSIPVDCPRTATENSLSLEIHWIPTGIPVAKWWNYLITAKFSGKKVEFTNLPLECHWITSGNNEFQ